jgi:hypothetical protein
MGVATTRCPSEADGPPFAPPSALKVLESLDRGLRETTLIVMSHHSERVFRRCRSLSAIRWPRHSRRVVPISRTKRVRLWDASTCRQPGAASFHGCCRTLRPSQAITVVCFARFVQPLDKPNVRFQHGLE